MSNEEMLRLHFNAAVTRNVYDLWADFASRYGSRGAALSSLVLREIEAERRVRELEAQSRAKVAHENRMATEHRARASIERSHYRQITAEQKINARIVLAKIKADERVRVELARAGRPVPGPEPAAQAPETAKP